MATTSTVPGSAASGGRALTDLRRHLLGDVVTPLDEGYDAARAVWNGSVDRRPALVARCAGEADVRRALSYAHVHGLPVAVRSGGHSFPGHSVCDGGVVVDLSPMRATSVDPTGRTAEVEAGVLLGELDAQTQPHGLAVPTGIVTHTGVGGLTLGGGLGWLLRRYGLSIDYLRGVDLVTAGGERVRASAEENPDLFWAVRGGGGNFGVVTRFSFDLVPLGPTVYAGVLMWPVAHSGRLMRRYRDWVAETPEELMTIVVHRKAPEADWVPAALQGQPVVAVACCYTGPVEDGPRVLAPLREVPGLELDACVPKPFLAHQAMFDPSFPHGWWYYFRACQVDSLTDEVIDVVQEHASRIGSPLTTFPIWHIGGAMTRADGEATAYPARSPGHLVNITAATRTEVGFAEERAWVLDFWEALAPHGTGGYVNFLMDEGSERVRRTYGEERWGRLRAVKQAYDPDNVFRLNQNIPPAGPARQVPGSRSTQRLA